MSIFVFENYGYDEITGRALFRYNFDGKRRFVEAIRLEKPTGRYNKEVLDEALFLAFLLIGTSYYKTFPTKEVKFEIGEIDEWQSDFLNKAYQEGLSQFASENSLTRDDLVHFYPKTTDTTDGIPYEGSGILSLQSGGKDSLLSTAFLQKKGIDFSSFYVSSSNTYPGVLDTIGTKLITAHRAIDRTALTEAAGDGGLNGHVPVTYIVMSIALLQAVLLNNKTVLTSIGHEGEEPREWIDDLPVNHQWSKTWEAEQLFSQYVAKYISPDLEVGSALRQFSELRIAELFAEKAWKKYGHSFSSCNIANYMQGADNKTLGWCGECPKCANSFLLFAPFVDADELKSLFGGQDLFEKPLLEDTFKGLLGIDGVAKPFECVGETDELRLAYGMRKKGYAKLPFTVPKATFDYKKEYLVQPWAAELI
jgi:hypothetical protein